MGWKRGGGGGGRRSGVGLCLLLSLRSAIDCASAVQAADVSSTIYSVLSRALPGSLENAPVPQLGDDELGCSFQELLGSAAASPALFQLLQRQAHLSLDPSWKHVMFLGLMWRAL